MSSLLFPRISESSSARFVRRYAAPLLFVIAAIAVLAGCSGTSSQSSTQSFGALTGETNISAAPNSDVIITEADQVLIYSPQLNSYFETFTVGTAGSGPGQLINASDAIQDSNSNLYVVDTGNDRVEVFDNANGSFVYVTSFGTQGTKAGQFSSPHGIAINSSGDLFVSDTVNGVVEEWVPNGTGYVFPPISAPVPSRRPVGLRSTNPITSMSAIRETMPSTSSRLPAY